MQCALSNDSSSRHTSGSRCKGYFGAIKKGDVAIAGQCPLHSFLKHTLLHVLQPTTIMACLTVQVEVVACHAQCTTPNIKGRKVGADTRRQGEGWCCKYGGGLITSSRESRVHPPPPPQHPQHPRVQNHSDVCLSFLSSSALLLDNSIPALGGDPSLHLPSLETKLQLYLELTLSDARLSTALLVCICYT